MRATAIELGQLSGFHDLEPAVEEFRAAVLGGLAGPQKRIPAKFFYDAEGSRLFDEICRLVEYYPTRTEIALLGRHADEIAAAIGDAAGWRAESVWTDPDRLFSVHYLVAA